MLGPVPVGRRWFWATRAVMPGRGAPRLVARHWGAGRGEPRLVRGIGTRRPGDVRTNEVTKECVWGGSAPPNGSRLSCGRPARRRKTAGRQAVPRQGRNTPLRLERSSPASFKRLLGSTL